MAQTTIQGSFLGDATVTGAKIGADFISAQTALTTGLSTTDEIIVSDAGVIKRMDISVLEIAATQITANGTLPVLNGSNLTTLPAANLTGTLPAISGVNLTALVAGNITAGGTFLAQDGSALTALNATQLTSGTMPDARFPATLPALNGAALTALNGTQITSGTVADARISALTASKLTGALPAISGANLTNLPASGAALTGSTNNTIVTVTGADAMQGEANLTYDGAELNVGGTSAKLVLDQGSGDGYIFELQSTDVTHGISGYGTNTFGMFKKKHAGSGMLQIWGFSDADANQAIGLSLVGVSGIAANTTKTTAAIGIVEINAGIKSGSGIANPGTNGNILVIRDAASGSAKMIVDQEGDLRVNENTSMPSVTKGIAKAWSRTQGWGSSGTIPIIDSHNIDSIADNGIGLFTLTWTIDFETANGYVNGGWGSEGRIIGPSSNASQAVGSSQNTAVMHEGTRTDSDPIMFVAFGEST
jgi:hypothetical protein